jgi:hypothetical protein
VVDFTTINTTTSTDLSVTRRCSLCGEPVSYWVAFLGGPRAAELMRYSDPPGAPRVYLDTLRDELRSLVLGQHHTCINNPTRITQSDSRDTS